MTVAVVLIICGAACLAVATIEHILHHPKPPDKLNHYDPDE
jgi:hypothetical protein